MKKQDFHDLIVSIKQAGSIRRGELPPARVTELDSVDVKAVRQRLGKFHMKNSVLFGCLLLGGCSMPHDQKVEVFGQVIDETGNHQLVLRFVEIVLPRPRQDEG